MEKLCGLNGADASLFKADPAQIVVPLDRQYFSSDGADVD